MDMDALDRLSDAELCTLAQGSNHAAEDVLVLRYTRLVRALARPLFLTGGDMEDLTQEGFLGLMSAIREYDSERKIPFSGFAHVCVKRRLYSAVRDARRFKHGPLSVFVPLEDLEILSSSDLASGNPEALLILREEADEHQDALNGLLSDLEAKILGMYLNGLSYAEIAEQLHRSPKSVDNAVQRIRRKLQKTVR